MLEVRKAEFSKNEQLENFLDELNQQLWVSEKEILMGVEPILSCPIVLVMGAMRSGTTILMQLLAQSGSVAYPTNLLSRFYHSPIIGAKIQLLLTDPRFRFRSELDGIDTSIGLSSKNGKTQGLLSPNEFWYFWRRFLSDPSKDVWTEDEFQHELDIDSLLRELAGLVSVYEKPFAAKGMIFNYHIPWLFERLKNVVFVHMQRDVEANVASVLDARKRQTGSIEQWYSFKIPEYNELKGLEPREQIEGQVAAINAAIEEGLSKLPVANKHCIQYEEFCSDPGKHLHQLADKLNISDYQYSGPQSLEKTR